MRKHLLLLAALLIPSAAHAELKAVIPGAAGAITVLPVPVTQGGTGTATQFTQGSIVFAGASGVYSQDNANLFYNSTSKFVGIGTSVPSVNLQVTAATGNTNLTIGDYPNASATGSGALNLVGSNSGSQTTTTFIPTQLGGLEIITNGRGVNLSLAGTGVDPAGRAALEVGGSMAVGATYATTNTPPTNGMIVQGSVGIGTNAPLAGGPLTITGITTGTNADFLCLSSTGVVLLQATACTISQRKLKENIADLDGVTAINDIMALKPMSYNLIQTNPPNGDINFSRPQYGFMAEDVAKVDFRLSAVEVDQKTPKTWRQEAVIALAIKGIQGHEAEIRDLQKQLAITTPGAFPWHKCKWPTETVWPFGGQVCAN